MNLAYKSDVMLNTIDCLTKSLKWYKKYFLHVMDMALLNSFNLYQEKTSQKKKLSECSLNLAIQLIDKFSEPRVQHTECLQSSTTLPLRLTE